MTGTNGDVLQFSYEDGLRHGLAVYTFADGSVETSTYQAGKQTGPAKFVWTNGAVREGVKVDGEWEGEVFYTYTEGPRAGKKDVETWAGGKMESSKKYYGKGENVLVENWEDLNRLESLTQ